MKRLISIILVSALILSISISSIPTKFIFKNNYIEFYDINNKLIRSEIKNKYGNYIPLNQINTHTINAFISYEDKNFYSHKGFDIKRIIRSFFTNLFTLSFKEGASTISQQYARSMFLSNDKTISRKIKEAYYTTKIEKKYTKNQILEGYLNSIYLGHGCYGIDAASNYYFNKSAKDLTLSESALLASLPSSPSHSSPYNNYTKAMSRKNTVLKVMLNQGYITTSQYNEATSQPIYLNENHDYQTYIDYYLDKVKEEIQSLNIPLNKGLKVYTNIDTNLYEKVSSILNKHYTNKYQLSMIILENNTNKILLNIGGFNYKESSYNRSLYSKRQVGSTIKTFLYSLALENHFNLSTELKSEKLTFNIKGYGTYSPSNANNVYANRNINMKEAYAVSDNIYAVKMFLLLGGTNFKQYLKKFNLYIDETVPSVALGSSSLTLFDLTKAYSVFANDGYYYNYAFVNKITDSYSNILHTSNNSKKIVINPSTLKEMKELMSLPFSNNNYYTKSTLANYDIKDYYGKSGSTSTDSYLILFNDMYTISVWLGNDTNENISDYTTTKYIIKELTNYI